MKLRDLADGTVFQFARGGSPVIWRTVSSQAGCIQRVGSFEHGAPVWDSAPYVEETESPDRPVRALRGAVLSTYAEYFTGQP